MSNVQVFPLGAVIVEPVKPPATWLAMNKTIPCPAGTPPAGIVRLKVLPVEVAVRIWVTVTLAWAVCPAIRNPAAETISVRKTPGSMDTTFLNEFFGAFSVKNLITAFYVLS
jgi:hypothetical protein